MKIKTKEGEERDLIEMEYSGKPFAIFITIFLVIIVTIIGGAYLFAFLIEKLTNAGIL